MRLGANTWIGGGLVALALGVAIFAPWIALTDPVMDANLMNAELPPSWEFPFGTDAQGRDIYSRICYGARISLTVGICEPGLQQPDRSHAGPSPPASGAAGGTTW